MNIHAVHNVTQLELNPPLQMVISATSLATDVAASVETNLLRK